MQRMVLGEDRVQGIDYIYTLQGWLKGVNHSSLDPNKDPGEDGNSGSSNSTVGKDAFGMVFGYFQGDFNRNHLGTNSPFNSIGAGAHLMGSNVYNGNITSWLMQSDSINGLQYQRQTAYKFTYDVINRLTKGDFYSESSLNSGIWIDSDDYGTNYSFDASGNLISLDRDAFDGTAQDPTAVREMDRFNYHYYPGTNRLEWVMDAAVPANAWDDIEGQNPMNYVYDSAGNLISDVGEGLTIDWNSYGKVRQIDIQVPSQGIDKSITFHYDFDGVRVSKTVKDNNTNDEETFFYVVDLDGNTSAIYRKDNNLNIFLEQQVIIGMSRLGVLNSSILHDLTLIPSPDTASRKLDQKQFELVDHLGNVRVSIGDIKEAILIGGVPSTFIADIKVKQDYYAFGMMIPGRIYSSSDYTFGFNGAHKDDDISGLGNHYDLGMRHYNPRIARMFKIDPRSSEYPWQTPYAYHRNNPINAIDYLGGGDPDDPVNHTAAIGGTLTLPADATVVSTYTSDSFEENGVTYDVENGGVQSFSIGEDVYTASFNDQTGAFDGYRTEDGKLYTGEEIFSELPFYYYQDKYDPDSRVQWIVKTDWVFQAESKYERDETATRLFQALAAVSVTRLKQAFGIVGKASDAVSAGLTLAGATQFEVRSKKMTSYTTGYRWYGTVAYNPFTGTTYVVPTGAGAKNKVRVGRAYIKYILYFQGKRVEGYSHTDEIKELYIPTTPSPPPTAP